mmetsp:Transcript_58120/g.159521  ORF Transcript_58120/g.159521 Transcript_58120/m.159521 type:complete len:864 (-) Transcript_58120:399-2990(-)
MREDWRPKVRVQVEDAFGNRAELNELPSAIPETAVQLKEITAEQHLSDDFFTGIVRATKVNAVTSTTFTSLAPSKSKHDALQITLVAGAPFGLQVTPAAFSLRHCSQLPGITVAVNDVDGNLCEIAPGVAVLEAEQQFKSLLASPKPLKVKLDQGCATLKPESKLCLKDGFPTDASSVVGTLLAKVTGRDVSGVGPEEVKVTIIRGNHPAKLSISSGGNQTRIVDSNPLTLDNLRVKVIAEDGNDLDADDDLAGRALLKFAGLDTIRNACVEAGQLAFTQLHLPNIGRRLEQAGELHGEVCLEAASGMPHIVSARITVTLEAATASQLVYKSSSPLSQVIDCAQPLIVSRGAIFEVQDAFGNPKCLPANSKMTLKSLFKEEIASSSMQGLQEVTIDGSRATLAEDILMTTTGSCKAKSGSYQLLLQVGGNLHLEHQFEYSEDALDDKTKKLNEQLREKQAELAELQSDLGVQERASEAAEADRQQCEKEIKSDRAKKTRLEGKRQQLQQSEEQYRQLLGDRNPRQQHQCGNRNMAYEDLDRAIFSARGGRGLIAELGAVESADVAKVLGVVLKSRLLDVVVQSNATIKWLEEQNLPETSCKAIALSEKRCADTHFKGQVDGSAQRLLKLQTTNVPAYSDVNGCLGYLVNLIVLEPEHAQELRTQLWWPLLRDSLLFVTKEQMRSWEARHPDSKNRLLSLDGGEISSSGMQNFAPPPEPCNFLKGVGASLENPVDPRVVQYRKARNERAANESEAQQLSDSIERKTLMLRDLTQQGSEVNDRKTRLAEDVRRLQQTIDDLTQQLSNVGALAGKQKANAIPPSVQQADPSSKRHKPGPGPSGTTAEDMPADADAAAGKKRKSPGT